MLKNAKNKWGDNDRKVLQNNSLNLVKKVKNCTFCTKKSLQFQVKVIFDNSLYQPLVSSSNCDSYNFGVKFDSVDSCHVILFPDIVMSNNCQNNHRGAQKHVQFYALNKRSNVNK